MMLHWESLHWLRPGFLWALAALPVLVWWWRRRRRAGVWLTAVDPHLLPHLLEPSSRSRNGAALAIGALGYVLAVLALSGPSLRQTEQPVWEQRAALVLAVDVSSASLAADVPPSRLARSRAKLARLLKARDGGQVGLVAYAGEAFTVAPLTDDVANVGLFLDALAPDVMPVDGQRTDLAIQWSVQLLQQAGFDEGTILLLTDHADAATLKAAAGAKASGYRVSVLGVGASAGTPYRAAEGGIAQARWDPASLRQLADAGGGNYATVANDDADLAALDVLEADGRFDSAGGGSRSEHHRLSWQDEGYWLLLPLMALALLAFRRGAPLLLLVCCLWLPGREAAAAELWQRPDQQAHQTMEQAAKAYRQDDFATAARLYGSLDSAEADYNRGNALAREGNYPDAVEAYGQALRRRPDMEDAIANRDAVQAAMDRQPQGGGDRSRQDARNKEPSPGDQGQKGQGQEDGQPDAGQQGGDTAGSGDDGRPSESSESGNGNADEEPASGNPPNHAGAGDDQASNPSASTGEIDAETQQAADEAQRERMREALQQAQQQDAAQQEIKDAESAADAARESTDERERRIANEAWLRRIPDDPGGLLRQKFRIEYQRRQRQGSEP